LILKINNDKLTCQVSDELDILLKQLGMDSLSANKVNDVRAPMPGLVLDVLVDMNQVVKKGDTLLVLEAMKMENNIKSPVDGRIIQIVCKPKTAVEKNDLLIVFE
jgi:biotin carboxyl carrier protein